jgi:hypothetical protein
MSCSLRSVAERTSGRIAPFPFDILAAASAGEYCRTERNNRNRLMEKASKRIINP